MRGFDVGGRYSFETATQSFEGEFIDWERSSNEQMFYFKNFEEEYRVTLVHYVPTGDWTLMASRLDGTHRSMTRPLLEPVVSLSPLFEPVTHHKEFDQKPVENLGRITDSNIA